MAATTATNISQHTSAQLPRALSLEHLTRLTSNCQSICHHNQITYVGVEDNEIHAIDHKDYSCKSFITNLGGSVTAIAIHEGFLYTLIRGRSYLVKVYDLEGQYIRHWCHIDSSVLLFGYGPRSHKLSIIDDQIVVPDRLNGQLVVYSLVGHVIKRISCSQIGSLWIAVCPVGADSVVVSDYETSRIFKISIPTGEIMWTTADVQRPEGVVLYGGCYLLVASRGSDFVKILSSDTGQLLGEVKAAAITSEDNCHVFDLDTFNSTLIIALYNGRVLFYRVD